MAKANPKATGQAILLIGGAVLLLGGGAYLLARMLGGLGKTGSNLGGAAASASGVVKDAADAAKSASGFFFSIDDVFREQAKDVKANFEPLPRPGPEHAGLPQMRLLEVPGTKRDTDPTLGRKLLGFVPISLGTMGVRSNEVTLIVADLSGQPVSGAVVQGRYLDALTRASQPTLIKTAGPDGRVRFEWAGRYQVGATMTDDVEFVATAPGFQPSNSLHLG